jgi:enamine deaminase RidA (YjgF/YER057c/UK114 family)
MSAGRIFNALGLALLLAAPGVAGQSGQAPGAAAPAYAPGATVPASSPLYFSSGVVSNVKDGGTMKEQALATMKRLEATIAEAGFGLGDVVFVRAYLRQGKTGLPDYAGWESAWTDVFGGRPAAARPGRTTVAVPAPNDSGGLLEIEYVCVTKDPAKMAVASERLALPVANPNLKPFGTKEGRIYAGMGVMPGTGMYWTAGITAPVIDSKAPPTSYDNRGDMYTQARNTLERLKENIGQVGLTLSDVVYVRAFLGPDWNKGGTFDVDGWNKAYGEFFNNPAQPHKPARTTATTPTFASNAGGRPISMIEIEFVTAFPKPPQLFAGEPAGAAARRGYGGPSAMFSSGVAVKPGAALYLSSGVLPTAGGDMKTQALSVLEALKGELAKRGASFKDAVFLRAYLVPAADGSVDRDGWNQAYLAFFNNPAQPEKPARVTIPVSSLPQAEAKIAIDLIAVVP